MIDTNRMWHGLTCLALRTLVNLNCGVTAHYKKNLKNQRLSSMNQYDAKQNIKKTNIKDRNNSLAATKSYTR